MSYAGNTRGPTLSIGGLNLRPGLVLAPLSALSDLPFRSVNRALGCELAYAQMINAGALIRDNRRTLALLASDPADRPLGVQLLGSDPDIVAAAVEKLSGCDIDLIDINAACPARKVVKRGHGAYLLKDPKALAALLRAAVCHSRYPVTVKIRTGWDDDSCRAVDIALRARDEGIKAIFIHGRTALQGHTGGVNFEAIREVKGKLDIPVIASGDALSPRLIGKIFNETGCDGVLIARGALGNPWIFRRTQELLTSGRTAPPPDRREIAEVMLRHLQASADHYGPERGTVFFRKHFTWYVKGLPGANSLRKRAFSARDAAGMLKIIRELGSFVPDLFQ